uniref:CSON002509 protein n=1 Tax=Culicoides sonorensis TaxID=179676 RepID=A0A336LVQ9_CULSO
MKIAIKIAGVLLLLVVNLSISFGFEETCCRNNTQFDEIKNNCKDHVTQTTYPVQLNCPKYMLDPEKEPEDEFTVIGDGSLIVGDTRFEKEEFCLTKIRSPDNSLHDVAFVCHAEVEHGGKDRFWIPIKICLISLSVIFLLLTLYIYYIIPELRQTEDKVTCIALFCLTIFMALLGVVQAVPDTEIQGICLLIGFGIYFFAIGYFSWLNCIMLNVWKNSVLPRWQIKEKNWFLLNNLYGWFIPILALLVAVIVHLDTPTMGVNSCFFHNPYEQWLFLYLPMSIMLGINLIFGIWTAWSLHERGDDISPDRKKRLRFKMLLYLRVFVLAGVTWIFEVLSFSFGESHLPSNFFWLLCDVINALHGVLIFFVLIMWRSRIKRELGGKNILGYKCPTAWSNVTDIEHEHLNNDEGRTMDLKSQIKA